MMSVILYVRFVITVLSIVMITNLYAWAIDESKVVASAEKIAKSWEELLPKKKDKVAVYNQVRWANNDGYWKVREFKNISVKFDVQKTGSIVSPYILIVSIEVGYYENDCSLNANAHQIGKWQRRNSYKKDAIDAVTETDVFRGFKTKEEALSHTDLIKDYCPLDKKDPMTSYIPLRGTPDRNYVYGKFRDVNVYYSYRGKFWEYKGFTGKDGESLRSCEEELLGGYVDLDYLERTDYFSKVLKDLPID